MRTTILGGGESGLGAALLAKELGHETWLSDKGSLQEAACEELTKHGIPWEEGRHTMERLFSSDQVIKSPGIPDQLSMIKDLRAKGIPVIGEIEFAARHSRARSVAITGSNGKTTTTLLTHHLLTQAGVKAALGGNVGRSFARLVVEEDPDLVVLELSSFQLDNIVRYRPDWAALLNISPDHLDRYEYDFGKYAAAKFRITMNQRKRDKLFVNLDNDTIRDYLPRRAGAATVVGLNSRQVEPGELRLGDLRITMPESGLHGRHNAMNALFAAAIALEFGLDASTMEAGLSSFRNAPHRMELVASIEGVAWINDSKATNVDSAWYALDAMDRPVIWIAGGQDKGNDYSSLLPLVDQKVKHMICLGVDNAKLIATFGDRVGEVRAAKSAEEAVAQAANLAEHGDVVLLAPACASFDLFKNYEQRGDLFRQAVQALKT